MPALGHVLMLVQNVYRCKRCGYEQQPVVIGPIQPPVDPPISTASVEQEDATAMSAEREEVTTSRVLASTVTEHHDYVYASGKLLREVITRTDADGNVTTEVLDFTYDASGNPYALTYTNGTETPVTYYYVVNLQGDVIRLVSTNGATVAQYWYGPYGEVRQAYGDMAEVNPLRYRSYYYDGDTEFYYLQSRYYDPCICRFINVDAFASTGQGFLGYNMFAYCGNNPVNRKDPTGQFGITALIITAVVAVCGVVLSGCTAQPSTPSNYVQENSTNQNCYSYAFDLPHSANPGDYSASDNSDYMFKDKNIYTPAEITGFIERDMDALNKSVRVVDSPKDKLENEYIVAMKTSTIVIPSIGVADYHFAVQLSDGSWADKPGQSPSRWNVLDGTEIAWDLGNIKNYYNTETVYFAVER